MPDSSRSSVDLPAPLWPTSASRSPSSKCRSMPRSASITTTLRALAATLPPTTPSTVCFRDRDFASKIGKSTLASWTSMLTIAVVSSDPVRDAAAVPAHDQQCQGPADDGDRADDDPVVEVLVHAQHRPPEDLHEVEDRVELHDASALGDVRVGDEVLVDPHDRSQEEQQLHHALRHRRQVPETGAHDAEEQGHPGAVEHQQAEGGEGCEVGPQQRLREDHEHDRV